MKLFILCKYSTKVLAYILSLSMLAAYLPYFSFETSADGKVQLSINDQTQNFTWDDNWFNEPSDAYNHELATVCSVLSNSIYYDQSLLNKNLKALGFDEAKISNVNKIDYQDKKYGNNQVGFSIASKKINTTKDNETDLVVLSIRGTMSAEEWLSNVNISNATKKKELYHEGFEKATEKVNKELQDYLTKNKINKSNSRIVITGHSRGAAVANILAAMLNDKHDASNEFKKDNIYAFTFATPNTCSGENIKNDNYNNIFNIINPEDLVTYVPLNNKWGYSKYGINLILPSKSNTKNQVYSGLYSSMNECFKKISKGKSYEPMETTTVSKAICAGAAFVAPSVDKLYNKKVLGYSVYNVLTGVFQTLIDFSHILAGSTQTDLIENTSGLFGIDLKGVLRFIFKFDINSYKQAFTNMHTPETYIAWMQSGLGDPEKVFVETSTKTIKLKSKTNVNLLNSAGQTVGQVIDGNVINLSGSTSTSEDGISDNVEILALDDGTLMFDIPEDDTYNLQLMPLEDEINISIDNYDGFQALSGTKYFSSSDVDSNEDIFTMQLTEHSTLDSLSLVAADDNQVITPSDNHYAWSKIQDEYWMYLKNDTPVVGWQGNIKGWEDKYFYFNENGIMLTAWQNSIPGWENKWFFFNSDGTMVTGWKNDILGYEGKWFFFNSDGTMATGWKFINGYWYYMYEDTGIMAQNTITPDGFNVDSNGRLIF